jgi:hypothetical protein
MKLKLEIFTLLQCWLLIDYKLLLILHGLYPLHLHIEHLVSIFHVCYLHSYDILGAGMLWKPKEARILTNFNECRMF